MVELNLTKRQQEIFDFIKRYSAKHGYPPTVRDIGKAIGLTSSSTVHAHLANLEKVGLLRRDPTKPRAIEVLVDKAKQAVVPAGLPLVGQVAAGQPMLAEENIEEYVDVPGDRRWRRGRVHPARRGRLDEGRRHPRGRPRRGPPQETARDGEIVVALVGEEATVKRFFKESDHVRLQPENEALEPIRDPRRRGAGTRGRCLQEGLMSQLLLAPRAARARTSSRSNSRTAPSGRPGMTLEERISRVWEDRRAVGTADCPVCRGPMERMGGSGVPQLRAS